MVGTKGCLIIASILGFGLISCREDKLVLTKSPKDVSAVEGTSVTLPCKARPDDGVVYLWLRDGIALENTTRRFMQGSNLHITRVDRERDGGTFVCQVKQVTGNHKMVHSSPVSILIEFIEDPTVVLIKPDNATQIHFEDTVVLGCQLDATGDVDIDWFHNEKHLSKDLLASTERHVMKGRELILTKIQSSSNGVYRCHARNAAGSRKSVNRFVLAAQGDQSLHIQSIPTDQIVRKGTTAFFDCVYKEGVKVLWYFNKNPEVLSDNERVTIHSNGTLQIRNVTQADAGVYICRHTDPFPIYSAELHVAFIENLTANSFEPPLINTQIPIGAGYSFQYTCLSPMGLPRVKKWWQNEAGRAISDKGPIHVDDDGRLIITEVMETYAGKYTCVAENLAGKTEKSIELVVTTSAEILQHPMSLTVDEYGASVLTCIYNTSFEKFTTMRWRKDGKIFKHEFTEHSFPHQRIRVFKNNGTLLILSTQTSDRGEYVCEVITEGLDPVFSKPATISVIEKLRFVPAPVNKKLELDSVAKIHCKAQGTPPPIIRWEKNGMSSENFPAHITDMNGTLHFNRVTARDKGKYNCIASNSQGTINASINIDVVVAPRFVVPPKSPINVSEGESIMIDCVVEGDPDPTIQWDKDLKMNDFDLTRFRVLENGSLHISEVYRDDQNKYGCTAGNSAGLNRKEVELLVNGPEADATVTKAFLITMSVAGAYIVLVVGLMVWCKYVRRSRKLPIADGKLENGDMENQELKTAENGIELGPSNRGPNRIEAHKEGQKSDGADTCNSQASNQSKKSKHSYDKLALSRTLLKELTLIGRGEFGDVMVAKVSENHLFLGEKAAKRISESATKEDKQEDQPATKEVAVLVKILTQTKDENCLTEFKREIDMFSKLTHEHITKLFGLCREQEPHYLIMEHTEWGDLKKFLVATKSGSPPPLTTTQGVVIAYQLSRAMDHLSNHRMVHKDLAARNCLLTSSLVVKVGLPRMTKEPYSQEYCKHANQVIPLRWLPYEAVYEDEYSTKSDVYAFAVVIWEIFSQGELPHSKINDNSFLAKLKEKKLEWKVHGSTPEPLQKLQELCWDVNPQNRPSFSQLSTDISEILKNL